MPLLDVQFKVGEDKNFKDGQIITIKPGGALWTLNEITEGTDAFTMDVTQEEYDSAIENISSLKVDNTAKPISINVLAV